jgi:hypothetical protein
MGKRKPKPVDFKDVYKFPLEMITSSKVMTSEFNMAFDFIPEFMEKEDMKLFKISKEDKKNIVRILNGEEAKINTQLSFRYENGTIFCNDLHFIWIRGWGYLTGVGGLHLKEDKAIEIQNQFAGFIIETLEKAMEQQQ